MTGSSRTLVQREDSTAPWFSSPPEGGKPMTATALAKHATPLRDVFERYHVGWETRNPDLIASLHSEDTVFHVHDGSAAVHGREALRQRCFDTFEKFDFS